MSVFVKDGQKKFVSPLTGVQRKTLAVGEKALMAKFVLETGAELPLHSHPHEQVGYQVSGQMIMTVAGNAMELNPGDSWAIAGGVEHQVKVLQKAEVIEVFVPIREDYLD